MPWDVLDGPKFGTQQHRFDSNDDTVGLLVHSVPTPSAVSSAAPTSYSSLSRIFSPTFGHFWTILLCSPLYSEHREKEGMGPDTLDDTKSAAEQYIHDAVISTMIWQGVWIIYITERCKKPFFLHQPATVLRGPSSNQHLSLMIGERLPFMFTYDRRDIRDNERKEPPYGNRYISELRASPSAGSGITITISAGCFPESMYHDSECADGENQRA